MNFYLPSSNTWWKIMRITLSQLLIVILLSGLSFAKSSKAQGVLDHTINITVNNSSLENTLKKLEKDASVKFVYSKTVVKTDQKVTLSVVSEHLKEVLSKLLTPKGITYSVINDHIVLNVSTDASASKDAGANATIKANTAINAFVVKGKVTDETGATLPGVTVKLKGTTTAAVTDIDGNYTISIPDGKGTLEFSYVGYDLKEVAIGGRNLVNASLVPASKSLNEVVVIGYGTQKRGNVTGATATLKNENLGERPITRVDQALVGQLAGVTVKQTTGVPGKAFSIQVRGSGSITAGNEPLYVIDGFPLSNNSSNTGNGSFTGGNPLDNINPADIENIQVLKDAAAAAIYGSRASNGVVLITTKRGVNGKPKITFNSSVGYNQASKKLQMLNGDQWIDRATEMINAAYLNTYGTAGANVNDNADTRRQVYNSTIADPTKQLKAGQINAAYFLDPRWAMPGHPGLEYVDWQSAIERKGIMLNDEISASGGNDFANYFVSGSYANQDGFVKGLGYKQYGARANVELKVAKNVKIGANLAPSYSITEDPGVEGKDNIFHQALSMSPVQEDSVGLFANIGKNAQYVWSNTTNSPYGKLQYNVGETKRYRTLATVFVDWEIIKGLNFRSSANLDNVDNNTRGYTPYITTGQVANRTFNATSNPNLAANTSGSYSTYRRQTFVNENTLTYNREFNKVHNLSILLGQSYNTDRLDQSSLSSVGGYTSTAVQTLSAAANTTGSMTSQKNILVSYFSRVQYSYKDKYLLSASLRDDGSSKFGPNNKYGIFPSASLGWRVVEEPFMKQQSTVSDLKLRVSFGVNGNNNIGNYASIATIASSPYVLGATQVAANGQAQNVLANPDIRWEKSKTWDAGVDFGFFANRLTGSFDYYNKLNTDLLLNVPILETTGFSSLIFNAGSVRNIGQELELTSHNLVGKFQWNTTFNISHNTNKIVSLYGNQSQIIIPSALDNNNGHTILKVGESLNSIYVVRQIGILTQADINNKVALSSSETVGDPKYEDFNGDGKIDANDRQIVGHPSPDYTWGITNTFRFKGFDLSVLVQGQNGGSVYSLLGRAITRTGQGYTDNAPEFYVNRWRSPDNTGAGRVSKAYSTFGFLGNTDWLYSSDYFRVRDITLGYNLKNVLKAPLVQGARIYITAENFFGHDKYYGGLNPDAQNTTISSNSNYPEAGDYGGLPLAKSLIFGVNFTF